MTGAAPVGVFDGHNDTLLQLTLRGGDPAPFFAEGRDGHIDLPRARRGGLRGGFFAVWVPPENAAPPGFGRNYRQTEDGYEAPLDPALDREYARRYALEACALLDRLLGTSGGAVRLVRRASDLSPGDDDVLRVVLHLEGAEPIRPDLEDLDEWYERGVRSIGIVWSRPNAFGHGVPFKYPSGPDVGPGLTDAGRALVRACNRRGIMVDLAHLNARGFWDVAEVTDRPLVVTHACAHRLAPTARNLTDDQLDAIGRTGGVLGLNFHVGDLREDGRKDPDTPLTAIVRHLDHVAGRIGVDHVALGSDFDGATVPTALGDAAGLPRLIDAMGAAGYDREMIDKIALGNWSRVLHQTWRGTASCDGS